MRRSSTRSAPPGIAGIGVLLVCLPFYFNALAPPSAELERRSAARRARVRPARSRRATTVAAELERFYSRFPTFEGLQGELEAAVRHARALEARSSRRASTAWSRAPGSPPTA